MRTVAIDTEYNYCDPFLGTVTDDELVDRVYRLKVLSDKKRFKEICENPNIRKVFHNASGDIFVLRNAGINVVAPYECTLIASNIVDENYASKNLKKLSEGHLGEKHEEANRLKSTINKYKVKAVKEGRVFKWSDIPEEIIIPYAKKDTNDTIKLWYYWQQPIEKFRKIYELEKSLIPIIVNMVDKGMRIDRYLCARMSREYGRKLEDLKEKMDKVIRENNIDIGDKEFNPNSWQQVQKVIKVLVPYYLQYKIHDEKTLQPKTDKDALMVLKNKTGHVFFHYMGENRFFAKHKGTYYDPLYDYYTSEDNDRGHFLLYQTGAKSARFSAELIQTFPKPEESKVSGQIHEVRKTVIPGKGKVLLCKDYEQQEMRLFIHYSNCKRMIDVINKKGGRGVDAYVETADIMFGELFQREKLRKALRWVSKQDTLGMIYGMGVNKMVWQTTHLMTDKFDKSITEELGLSEKWAYEVLQNMYKLYPVREFMNEKVTQLYKQGYVRLEFHSKLMDFIRDYRVPQDKAYKAVNIIIQGCLYGGSRVLIKEYGYITLREIKNKYINIWDGEKYVKAQCLYSGKKKKVIVQFKNGQQIICSPEHKFLRINANVEWCEAKNLKRDFRIVINNSVDENLNDIRQKLQFDFDLYDRNTWSSWSSNKIDFGKISDFDLGVLIGRLVSDGSINRDCQWLIAEHEFEIFEYIKRKLELMGKILVVDKGIRKDRNERIYVITLSSARLAVLWKILKSDIPCWVFENTDLLKGYLRGLFDGDGSVNNQGVITLVQGGKTSWIFMRKIQEALLMFGVKSRLRFYNYGYRCFHLQITTRDAIIFKNRIGFINSKKQNKIKSSKYRNKSDYLFRTERVKLVKICDEEIDMYDIVNSESGRYVANGIVTHNTAAYVIKCAMLRLDNRIEREGWRNKVDLIMQVHDELIFEVDKDMDLKHVDSILSEEMEDWDTFKVPITCSAKWSDTSWGDVIDLK